LRPIVEAARVSVSPSFATPRPRDDRDDDRDDDDDHDDDDRDDDDRDDEPTRTAHRRVT
jgi:hypothetical protein